jgi:sterol desaturase/sphingolipid hydroxylase (fatty acid hydroxylase superfamily)
MEQALLQLSQFSAAQRWLLFGAENLFITFLVLWLGGSIRTGKVWHRSFFTYPARSWSICLLTNVLNTVITYAGYWLWQKGWIVITFGINARILTDFLFMFLAMDLLMYVFHLGIHKTFLYRIVHGLHHEAVDPEPIDLFILHPAETLGFGSLWLLVLVALPLNAWAIAAYLVVNVLFGMIGHLGMEPFAASRVWAWLGTSSFHHAHHREVNANFGFYTTIWDRIFGTYRP